MNSKDLARGVKFGFDLAFYFIMPLHAAVLLPVRYHQLAKRQSEFIVVYGINFNLRRLVAGKFLFPKPFSFPGTA
jgi:hypothetical protein